MLYFSLILNIFMESGIKKSEGNVKLKCILSESDGYCAKSWKIPCGVKRPIWVEE